MSDNFDDALTPDELDEDNPLWLVNEQIKGLLEGIGASEDHEDVISFFTGAGLPKGTVGRIHKAIVCAEKFEAERAALVRDIRIANKNLFDMQEAAKIITKQAIAAEAERDALVNVERRLRRMLCRQRHGLSAYMDDGEATFGGDEFQRPTDYLRESLDSIQQAWIEVGLKEAALAEPNTPCHDALARDGKPFMRGFELRDDAVGVFKP